MNIPKDKDDAPIVAQDIDFDYLAECRKIRDDAMRGPPLAEEKFPDMFYVVFRNDGRGYVPVQTSPGIVEVFATPEAAFAKARELYDLVHPEVAPAFYVGQVGLINVSVYT